MVLQEFPTRIDVMWWFLIIFTSCKHTRADAYEITSHRSKYGLTWRSTYWSFWKYLLFQWYVLDYLIKTYRSIHFGICAPKTSTSLSLYFNL